MRFFRLHPQDVKHIKSLSYKRVVLHASRKKIEMNNIIKK